MTKFGAILPTGFRAEFGQEPQELRGKVESFALRAEQLGFESLWAFDHLSSLYEGYPCLEAWTTLAFVAGFTTKIRIGTLVTCNSFREPGVLMQMAATVDNISKGRLNLGIGAGWYQPEFLKFGIQFERPGLRVRRLEKTLRMLKSAWGDTNVVSDGKRKKLDTSLPKPQPYQRPHPPILISCRGERMLRLAAKYGDGWNMTGSLHEYKENAEKLGRFAKEAGRHVSEIEKTLLVFLTLGETPNELRDMQEEEKRIRGKYEKVSISTTSQFKLALHDPGRALRFAKAKMFEKLTSARLQVQPDTCVDVLTKFREAGAEHFIIHFMTGPSLRPLELFAEKVKPAL